MQEVRLHKGGKDGFRKGSVGCFCCTGIDLLWCCRSRQLSLAIRGAGLGRRLGGWRLRDTSAASKSGVEIAWETDVKGDSGYIVYIVKVQESQAE